MKLKNIFQKRKNFFIFFGFLLIFLIIALFLLIKSLQPPQIPSPQISPLPVAPISVPDKEIILKEFESCLTEEPKLNINNDWKDIFYLIAKALINKSNDICLKLENENAKTICLDDFNILMSLINQKEEDCQKLSKKIDQLMCAAIIKRDPQACSEIEIPLKKETCKAVASLDPKYCHNLSGSFSSKEMCKKVLGLQGIKEDCGEIDEEKAKSLCYNSLYLVKALKEKNLKICEKIDLKTGRFTLLYCKVLLSLHPEETLKNFYREHSCYEKYAVYIARIKNDPSVCEKIPVKETHNKLLYKECKEQFK